MAKFACIGSRDADEETIANCEKLGLWIAKCGGEVHSGNADGVDQAFARGANQKNPGAVYLHLPWGSYNRGAIVEGNHLCDPLNVHVSDPLCASQHPKWATLGRGVQALHRRNVAIIMPKNGDCVDLCIAAPSTSKPWSGGTAMGMKIATIKGVEVVNINHRPRTLLDRLCERIRRLCSTRHNNRLRDMLYALHVG
jgi:hypothetical protein